MLREEVILALVSKYVEERLAEIPYPKAGLRGMRGPPGTPGKDFCFEEYQDQIKSWIKDSALKFSDLTDEQLALLRGPRGKDGHDGRDFVFEDHAANIKSLISSELERLSPELKLKFEDLTLDERESLRGPRGQRGKPGKDFYFEEHRAFFESLKLKFSDLSDAEKTELQLKFSHLTAEERDSLRLKFVDLTFDEKQEIRGPRGQRGRTGENGKKGPPGEQGERGPRGLRGLPGPVGAIGARGPEGLPGVSGINGLDAPYITDIRASEGNNSFTLIFYFSDGSKIESNKIDLPSSASGKFIFVGAGQGGAGDSGTTSQGPPGDPGAAGESAYQIALDNGFVGTAVEWLASLKGDTGATGAPGSGTDAGILLSVVCDSTVFVGAAVRLSEINLVQSTMGDWNTLQDVSVLTYPVSYDLLAQNALADSMDNANVRGLVESKPTSTTCNIRLLGVTGDLYTGLELSKEYFLSDVTPGKIVKSTLKPTNSGKVVVKIGQPAGSAKMFVQIGDRVAIA